MMYGSSWYRSSVMIVSYSPPYYPKIKSDIPSGIEENGVVLFDPLNYNLPSARFEFQATRQDTYDTFNFLFPVAIPK